MSRESPGVTLWDACFSGDVLTLRKLIDAKQQNVDAHPPKSRTAYQPTALAYAVWGNQSEAVEMLLEAGADPDLADGDDNYCPLHWATYKGDHAECAQLLVDAGAGRHPPSPLASPPSCRRPRPAALPAPPPAPTTRALTSSPPPLPRSQTSPSAPPRATRRSSWRGA